MAIFAQIDSSMIFGLFVSAKVRKEVAVASVLFVTSALNAQLDIYRAYDIPVTENGTALANPWTGGLHCPQFSPIDINMDGKQDIFIFDRMSNRILIYISENDTPGQMTYRFTRQYNHLFPPGLRDWVLLRDYNCDGLPDIFTRAPNAVRVFKNISTPETGLQFEMTGTTLMSSYNLSGNPFMAQIYNLSIDLPAIHDHDDDLDQEIFTFTEDASTIFHYKSKAVETGDCDTHNYKTVNRCYAFVEESSASNDLYLGVQCAFQVFDPEGMEMAAEDRLHAGGTVMFFDTNADGFKEVIIGDIAYPTLKMLTMGPSSGELDSAYVVTGNFPAGLGTDVAVNISEMPSCFYFDLDNDGISDLVCSPQNTFTHEDMTGIWFYKNHGANDFSDFEFITDALFQESTIDLGTGAVPAFADFTGNGLPDLFVGNQFKFFDNAPNKSFLWLYRNVGSLSEPAYELVTTDYLNLSQYNFLNICVTFGDINGDGSVDMILGEQTGRLYYFANTASPGQEMNLILMQALMTDSSGDIIDVGQNATPQLVDMDEDGLLDLVIGEKNGNVNYYRNTGTANQPSFTLITEAFGGAQADNYLSINGYSVPHVFRDSSGTRYMLLGNEKGFMQLYSNLEGNFEGQFTLLDSEYLGIKEGDFAAPNVIDINHDGRPDLFLGQVGGGLAAYMAPIPGTVESVGEITTGGLNLFPNPAKDRITLEWDGVVSGLMRISIVDLSGRTVKQMTRPGANRMTLPVNDLARGIYLLKAETGNAARVVRFVVE
jgi:hypothetical protein